MEQKFSHFITDVLQRASVLALQSFGTVSGTIKYGDSNQVVTETDLQIGNFLISQIQAAFPDHNIIDEEAGVIDQSARHTWIIDPVDGTSNFAAGVSTYGIMLGLLLDDIPIAGGISLPSFQELYIAENGSRTLCNGSPVFVTGQNELSSVLVAYGIDGNHTDPECTRNEIAALVEIILSSRNLRTSNSCFDCVQVAKGSYGACLNQTSKIWDNVAQQIIIEQAGGVYTDFFGEKMDYSNCLRVPQKNFTWCFAPPSLHKALQTIINKHPK